ncbi:BA14K family protein [Amorphus orientalis]|uniref:Lectin-like protein BA14k n=1 Tax=Amorphus orientalis TaxID=649198 RepID=A0AAE3VM77_9HYPH|nr:BA14K family protein [Amorphus orientalis]MDQ0314633.1 hypothetical protein [Amorphus orientalis]
MMKKWMALVVATSTVFGTMPMVPASAAPLGTPAGPSVGSRLTEVQMEQLSPGRNDSAFGGVWTMSPNAAREQHIRPREQISPQAAQRHDDGRRHRGDGNRHYRGDKRYSDNRYYRDHRRYRNDRRYYGRRGYYDGGPRWRGPRRYYEGRYWRPSYDGWYVYNDGAWIAAGALGLAAGAILGSALAQPSAPATVQSGAPATRNGIPPWTPAWYRYCGNKYKSFNPQTGLYLGYDGKYHYCQ